MALNGKIAKGDDQIWKLEAEKIIQDLLIRVKALESRK